MFSNRIIKQSGNFFGLFNTALYDPRCTKKSYPTIINQRIFLASRRFMKSMTLDGSVAVCVLAKLREDPIGGLVFLASKDKAVPLGAVVNAFSGDLCPHLQGRPKLFFFLDKGVTEDSMHPITQNQVSLF